MAGQARAPGVIVPALELRGVSKRFGAVCAVDGVSLKVDPGERVAVIGPNGAGKSTLFGVIAGELRPNAGDVLLHGRALEHPRLRRVPAGRRAKLGLGRTFQSARLFMGLSAWENVKLAAREAGRREERDVASALSEVDLMKSLDRRAGALSQGERKRLELAMVLASEPKVLLLDEPTAGMGPEERVAIMDMIAGSVKQRELTMVFTEHDMDSVFGYAHRIVVMDRGRPIADGKPMDVRYDRRVREVYLDAALPTGGDDPCRGWWGVTP